MLTVQEVAEHWRLTPAAVRARIHGGGLPAFRIAREFRLEWPDVWANEAGPMPRGANQGRYTEPLLTKADLAGRLAVGTRTVERWISDGLPTRNVGPGVRVAPHDAEVWLARRFGIESDLAPRSATRRGAAGRFVSNGFDAGSGSHRPDPHPHDTDGTAPPVAQPPP